MGFFTLWQSGPDKYGVALHDQEQCYSPELCRLPEGQTTRFLTLDGSHGCETRYKKIYRNKNWTRVQRSTNHTTTTLRSASTLLSVKGKGHVAVPNSYRKAWHCSALESITEKYVAWRPMRRPKPPTTKTCLKILALSFEHPKL